MLAGVEQLADSVGLTLGPRGRTVLLANGSTPHVTSSGVEVAIALEFSDRLMNLGCELVRDVASQTCAPLGDGTTTAIVLARAMAREAVRLAAAGLPPHELKLGLDEALAAANSALTAQARPVREHELERLALLASGGDESCAALLARAFAAVGADGFISIEAARGTASTLELEPGARFERGYLSPHFVTNPERAECVLDDARVLLVLGPLSQFEPLIPLLEAAQRNEQALLIVAEDVLDAALSGLVVNRLKSGLRCAAVRSPGFGAGRREHLRDLAALTGAPLLGDEAGTGLEGVRFDELGRVRRALLTRDSTTLLGGAGAAKSIRARRSEAERELAAARDDAAKSPSERAALAARARQLADGAAVIRVGAASQLELEARKDRLEDAESAVRAAFAGGVVPGAGVALLRCEAKVAALPEASPGVRAGREIVRRALESPLARLLANAGSSAPSIVATLRAAGPELGFDALALSYCDLEHAGILDPLRVVQGALTCAGRVASLLLTSGACLLGSAPRLDDFSDV